MNERIVRLGMKHTQLWVRLCLGILALTTLFMLYQLISQSGQISAQAARIDSTTADRAQLSQDVDTLRGQVLALGEQPVVPASDPIVTSGRPGADGTDGEDGSDGINGVTGPTGIPGIDGLNGINGADGQAITGPSGASGASGASGQQGAPGVNGTNGVDGTDGTNGIDGAAGINGAQGRGISDTTCVGDASSSFWQITYTDGEVVNAGGPCSVGDTSVSRPGPTESTEGEAP